jgi:hypothetical protein
MKYFLIGLLTLCVMLMIISNITQLHFLGGLLGVIGGYILGGTKSR